MTPSPSFPTGNDSSQPVLGKRIRDERAQRGWDQSRLAREAGISRTTLSQLENGRGPAPRPSTVGKVTRALDLPSSWWDEEQAVARSFDRATNPEVQAVAERHPEAFAALTSADWDELHSVFGTGGALTEEGVLLQAARLHSKRELIRQLEVVLETHLGEAATAMIQGLYERVTLPTESLREPSKQ